MNPIDFIKSKIVEAEHTLKMRMDMQKCWAGGTDKSWRLARCLKPKSERMKESEKHGRIAVKNRGELENFKEVLKQLESKT